MKSNISPKKTNPKTMVVQDRPKDQKVYDTAARSAPQYRDKTDGRNEIGKIKNNEDVIYMLGLRDLHLEQPNLYHKYY